MQKNTIEAVEYYFRRMREGREEKPFWSLYQSDTERAKGSKAASNYHNSQFEESLGMLLEFLESMGPSLKQYLTLEIKTSAKDGSPMKMSFRNDMYMGRSLANGQFVPPQNAGIAGVNGYGHNTGMYGVIAAQTQEKIEMLREQHAKELEALRRELEHKREIEQLQERIEGLESSSNGVVKQIGAILEHPALSSFLGVLGGKIAAGVMDGPKQPAEEAPRKEERQQNVGEQQSDYAEAEDLQAQMGRQLESDLGELEAVFGQGESVKVITELARAARANPNLIKSMRPQLQNMGNAVEE